MSTRWDRVPTDIVGTAGAPGLGSSSGTDQVRIAKVIRGRHWLQLGQLANHLHGHGARTLVACGSTGAIGTPLTAGVKAGFYFWAWPSAVALTRYWVIKACSSGTARAQVDVVSASGNASWDMFVTGTGGRIPSLYQFHELVDPIPGGQQFLLDITCVSGSDPLEIRFIGCYEVPRAYLDRDDGPDFGCETWDLAGGAPMIEDDGRSLHAVSMAAWACYRQTRRAALFHWCRPDVNPKSTTASSGSPDAFFPAKVDVAGRRVHVTEGVAKATVRARAYCTDGTTEGVIRFESVGDSLDIVVSGTSISWFEGTLDLLVEAWDHLTVTWWRSAGTGTVRCDSIAIGEAVRLEASSSFSAANYLSLTKTGALHGSEAMTRLVCFRLDSVPAGDEYVFAKGDGVADGWSFRVDSSGLLRFRVDGTEVVSDEVLVAGKSYVAVGTYDGAELALRVNAQTEPAPVAKTGPVATNALVATVGCHGAGLAPFTSGAVAFAGAGDARALSAAEREKAVKLNQSFGIASPFDGVEHMWDALSSWVEGWEPDRLTRLDFAATGAPSSVEFDPWWG